MFSRSGNSFLIFLLSYHVRVTLKIKVNFRFRRYLKVLMILSYGFSQFLQYLCFQGQGIHCRHSQWAAIFGWPRKSRSTSGTGGTRRYWWLCLIDFWNFFTIYVFEVKESIADIPTELPCSGDLENPGQFPVQEVLMILSCEFSQFLQYWCFWGQGIQCRHSYWATMFEWPRKSRSTSGSGGTWRYWWFCLVIFPNFFSIHVFEVKESIADIPTELLCSSDLENLGQLPVQEVLMILTYKILKFFHCLCYRG